MVNKPDYIQYIEIHEGVFSVMKFHLFDSSILKYFDEKSFNRVYEVSKVASTGRASWDEVIFETNQQFYLHLFNNHGDQDQQKYWLHIYYKAEKRNELLFFTTQILKPFKDGSNNN